MLFEDPICADLRANPPEIARRLGQVDGVEVVQILGHIDLRVVTVVGQPAENVGKIVGAEGEGMAQPGTRLLAPIRRNANLQLAPLPPFGFQLIEIV